MEKHKDFMERVQVVSSHEAQTERYLAESTETKSDLNSMAKRDAIHNKNRTMGTFIFTIEGNNRVMGTFPEQEKVE